MSSNSGKSDHSLEDLFGVIIIVCLTPIIFFYISKVYSFFVNYIFLPIIAPVHLLGNWVAIVMGFIFLALWGFLYFQKKHKDKITPSKFYLLGYAFLFILGAIFDGITAPIDICNPSQPNSWNYITTCTNTYSFIVMKAPFFVLWKKTFFYNLLFLIPAITSGIFYLINTLNKKLDPISNIRVSLNFQELMEVQALTYTWLNYYLKLKLSNKPFNSNNMFGRMQTVRAFVIDNRTIEGFISKPDPNQLKRLYHNDLQYDSAGVQTQGLTDPHVQSQNLMPRLHRVNFETVMLRQLGDLFTDFANLDDLELFLMAVAVPRACCYSVDIDNKEVDTIKKEMYKLLDDQWLVVTNAITEQGVIEKDIFTPAFRQKLLDRIEPFRTHKITLDTLENHAYNRTVAYAFVIKARLLGVLASTDFGWFKAYDRVMWALIQNVGRESYYAECVAVSNHYYAEKSAGRAILKPQIQESYEATVVHLMRFNFNRDYEQAWQEWHYMGDKTKIEDLREQNRM